MTKYILAGGEDMAYPAYASSLQRELASGSNKKLRVLSCFFSSESESWAERADSWRKWFSDNLNGLTRSYDYANEGDFLAKIEKSDLIFFHGGRTQTLIDKIAKYPELQKYLAGKIVIGSSAGANMLSRYYWSPSHQRPGQGRGFVNQNVMVHYGARDVAGIVRTEDDWLSEERRLIDFIGAPDAKILHLPEGTFKVFEVND